MVCPKYRVGQGWIKTDQLAINIALSFYLLKGLAEDCSDNDGEGEMMEAGDLASEKMGPTTSKSSE